jgi:hypothetical protein
MKKTLKALIILILVGLMFAVISCDTTTGGGKGKAQYRVDIDINCGVDSPYVNAHVWEANRHIFVENAKISIDDKEVEKDEEYELYYIDFEESWEEGSTHSYKIETPDGVSEEGTFTISLKKLTGATCEDPKDKIVGTYTVSPPPGGWPQNSYLELCYKTHEGEESYMAIKANPIGNKTESFKIYDEIEKILKVEISSAIKTPYELKNYYAGSALTFIGPEETVFEINLEN